MRYAKIFLLHFQEAFDNRGRSLVWFLIPLVNIAVFLLFWIGAYHERGTIVENWSLSSISSYYFLLLIASSFLVVHIEENVARYDIQYGGLTKYLLKPFSYYWMKFYEEIPWRIIQGSFGLIIFIFFLIFFNTLFQSVTRFEGIVLSVLITVLAFFISFTFKMIIGLSALWITDYSGFEQVVQIVTIILSGILLPIEFFPSQLQAVAYLSPFPYMVYFPILAFSGKLLINNMLSIIGAQLIWILIFSILYLILWRNGIRKYTSFGQ